MIWQYGITSSIKEYNNCKECKRVNYEDSPSERTLLMLKYC